MHKYFKYDIFVIISECTWRKAGFKNVQIQQQNHRQFILRQRVTIKPIPFTAVATVAAAMHLVSLQAQQWDSYWLWIWPGISNSSHSVLWSV